MNGLMMDVPLRLTPLLDRAERYFPAREVVTRTAAGVHRTCWGEIGLRARRLASGLRTLGLEPFERVATFGWNTHRQVELYYAVPGAGFVLHTLNLRLFPGQVAWIARHARDRVVFVDDVLVEAFEPIAAELDGVRTYVFTGDGPLPQTSLAPLVHYEELIERGDPSYRFPVGDEGEAALLCYTSGTTGDPKGVLYSHRSLAWASTLMSTVDGFGVGERDSILVAVPLFHAAGWCLPYLGAMVGAKLVLPGPNLAPADVAATIAAEGITFSAGVPTLWNGVAALAESSGRGLEPLRRVVCAGSAVPATLIERFERLGVEMRQAWGMTEAPLGTMSRMKQSGTPVAAIDRFEMLARQGLPGVFFETRIVDDEGRPLPEDGVASGELEIRGPNVARGYFEDAGAKLRNGWFPTGDVATIDPEGHLVIRDRTKDVIKSGGEWISSLELERLLALHPDVAEVAVIARPDDKWVERPLACVVCREGRRPSAADLHAFVAKSVARWWTPEDFAFVPEVPKTSVGKLDKKRLREQLSRGELPVVSIAKR